MTARLAKTETRVLQAMRLVDSVHAKEIAEQIDRGHVRADELAPGATERCLQGFELIYRAARIVAVGRKSSEREIYAALQKLVDRGLVEKSVAAGMGGALALYLRVLDPAGLPSESPVS